MHYPVSILATLTSHAEKRVRIQHTAGGRVEQWVVLMELERAGTAYRAELAIGQGVSAAVVASARAARLRRGQQVAVHADRERIVTGRKPRIDLLDVQSVEHAPAQAGNSLEAA